MSGAVLVVDDEKDLVDTYERLLRRLGYPVIAVGSRAEGLRALGRDRPRLVIADLRLPDGDGLDVVRAARALPVPVPTIVVTVLTSRTTRQAALGAGACAFLAKPFTNDSFSRLVRESLAAEVDRVSPAGPSWIHPDGGDDHGKRHADDHR